MCRRCHKKGRIARISGKLPLSVVEVCVTHVGKQTSGLPGQPEVDVPQKGCSMERKRYAYRGIIHLFSIIYGVFVEEVCVTVRSRDAPPVSTSCLVDVFVTPRLNVSVKHNEDDRISHQDDIPIANSCVQIH